MKVYLVYEADAWLSYDSQHLIAVCTDYETAMDFVLKHAIKHHGVKSYEDIPEDDYDEDADYVENIMKELDERDQYLGNNFGYRIETVETNTEL